MRLELSASLVLLVEEEEGETGRRGKKSPERGGQDEKG
jgi:hypothetical protein